jgi:deoxyhypusine synthase
MIGNKFLQKKRIFPDTTKLNFTTIEDLIVYYSRSGAYNGGRLSEACEIYEKMINEDVIICLTVSGALTPTGIGGHINQLIKNGLVDFIISTGANLYHDLHFALDLPVYQGDFRVNDVELLKEKIVRIYDIFIPEETLFKTDDFIRNNIKNFSPNIPISTADLHNFIGKTILEKGKKPEYSILAFAAKYDLPIFSPSPGDSSVGMNLALVKMFNNTIVIDTDLDILESTAIVFNSEKTGVVELGGGAPKNFYMQTQPMLNQIMNIDKGGHNYIIQITADAPHWGGLSGATPSEAISWKKIKPNELKNDVVVYCDVTVAAPLLFSYILSKKLKRKGKHLYSKRKLFLNKLKASYNNQFTFKKR